MTTKKIRKLAEKTFTKQDLDGNTLKKISTFLGKKWLKVYIRELKNLEKKHIVKVIVPKKSILTYDIEKSLQKFFVNKKIDIIEDPTIIAGMRIIDNDMIYELNLRDSLVNMIDHIQKNYD